MAHAMQRADSMIPWTPMLKKWTWYTGQNAPSKVEVVKRYFNTFVSKHRNYDFIVAQIYSGLYDVGVTWQQYEEIKRELEGMVGLHLPDARDNEFLVGGSRRTQSFYSRDAFRNLEERVLPELNKPIVAKKGKEAKKHYDMVTRIFREPEEKVIISFDLEVYEYDFEIMLEIGYIVIRFSPSTRSRDLPAIEVTSKRHFIIEENLHYKNKDFVPDNRDGYVFGSSHTVSQEEAVKNFREYVKKSSFLLGHSVKNDDEYLKKIGVDLSSKIMWDTQLIEMYKEIKPNDKRFFTRGLPNLLKNYDVSYEEKDLHNAGCDACYTMLVFLRQMGYSKATVNGLLERY